MPQPYDSSSISNSGATRTAYTKNFPGETVALLEVTGIKTLSLRKTHLDPYISFAKID